jgi:sec-independent protein translocase protein TatA
MPFGLRGPELLILLLIIVLLFGAKKLPETARGIGRSLRIFKAETKGLRDDDEVEAPAATSEPLAPPAQLPPVTAVHDPVSAPRESGSGSTAQDRRAPDA